MRVTVTGIKADVGSVGGHICPSRDLLEAVRSFVAAQGADLLIDTFVSFTGDDIAILMTHTEGVGSERIHHLAWDAFVAGTAVARRQGLY
ncbi:MAG: fructose 1,6-bisphosphatase, partial [Gemmatimonadetes bacterium]|nr:fructose 1,6-bisphosphatase [Gemmatimonadota bacterium]